MRLRFVVWLRSRLRILLSVVWRSVRLDRRNLSVLPCRMCVGTCVGVEWFLVSKLEFSGDVAGVA